MAKSVTQVACAEVPSRLKSHQSCVCSDVSQELIGVRTSGHTEDKGRVFPPCEPSGAQQGLIYVQRTCRRACTRKVFPLCESSDVPGD